MLDNRNANDNTSPMELKPRILTNMAFWQSPRWMQHTDSIYPLSPEGPSPDPMPWWREAVSLWRRASAYDVVVTMGARESLLYAWLCLLTGRKSRQIMCEVFVDDPSASGLWRIKQWAYRIAARRAIGILTNSSAEVATTVARFAAPPGKVRYVPMHTNIARPAPSLVDAGYIFAAGRSLRDYDTLVAAMAGAAIPVKIMCGHDDLADKALPKNVTVIREANRDDYLTAVRECTFMVVPLLPTERATGQVVVLEAMAFGKAVIATRVGGVADLIRDNETGLFVPPQDADALRAACAQLWQDAFNRKRIAQAGFKSVLREYTIDRHSETKLAIIAELWLAHSNLDKTRR